MKKFLLIVFASIVIQNLSFSQENPSDSTNLALQPWYEITKNNGVKYIGKIISDDGREVLIDTKDLGKIYIPKSDIKSIKKIEDEKSIVYGEYRTEGPFTTRYYLTTNALPVKRGENYSLLHLWGPEMHFAVSNSTSIGFVATWIGSPIALAVKQNFKTSNEKLNFSIGTLTGTTGYLNMFKGFGSLLFGNVTYGSRMSNVTFSAGIAAFNSDTKKSYGINYYFQDTIYGNLNTNTTGISYQRPTNLTCLFSVSGITKIGTNISFIYDMIFSVAGVSRPVSNNSTVYGSTYYFGSNYGNNHIDYNSLYTIEKYNRYYIVIMPSIRIQTSEKSAFQFSLGGVSMIDKYKNISFPFPMCSWFYKFNK